MVAKRIIIILMAFFLVNCGSTTIKNPEYINGIVYSTKHVHWGKGYYKLKVYYTFKNGDSLVHSTYMHKLERAYTSKYKTGDSVLIQYNKVVPNKNRIIKIIYKNRKTNYQVSPDGEFSALAYFYY